MNSAMAMIRTFPLLSQEGWDINRWRAGVVPKRDIPRECGFGTTPRVIASQSRCPFDLGGQREFLTLIQFTHSFMDPACSNLVDTHARVKTCSQIKIAEEQT